MFFLKQLWKKKFLMIGTFLDGAGRILGAADLQDSRQQFPLAVGHHLISGSAASSFFICQWTLMSLSASSKTTFYCQLHKKGDKGFPPELGSRDPCGLARKLAAPRNSSRQVRLLYFLLSGLLIFKRTSCQPALFTCCYVRYLLNSWTYFVFPAFMVRPLFRCELLIFSVNHHFSV